MEIGRFKRVQGDRILLYDDWSNILEIIDETTNMKITFSDFEITRLRNHINEILVSKVK